MKLSPSPGSRDRLHDIEPPELEIRIAILRKYAAVESIALPDDVAMYIASSINSNARVLEGALIRIAAYALLAKKQIDLEFAQETLEAKIMLPREVITVPKRERRRPPLQLLNATVKALWSAKTYERVFKPVITDVRHEWADARRRHEKFRAWWIRNVRGRYAVFDVARHQLPWSAWSAIRRLLQLMFKFSK